MHVRASASACLFLLSAVLGSSCQREESGGSTREGTSPPATAAMPGAPKLDLYVMSQCPYGVEAEKGVVEAKKQLGAGLDVAVHFIGDGAPGSLSSMHGPAEVTGDLAQVCVIEQARDRTLAFIDCQNQNPRAVDTNWRECAQKLGIEVAPLEACIKGEQGQKLLAASFDDAKKRGAQASPTIYLAGKPYEAGRKGRDFVRAACDAFEGKKPEACARIPVPPRVSAIFLSDSRCKECDVADRLEPRLRSELGGLVMERVDYSTDAGKALYKELVAASPDFKTLPTILLGAEVEKDTDGYAAIGRFVRPIGKYRELRLGGQWDPTAEICDNKGDDDGDGDVDCRDSGCKQFLGCRAAKPKQLDLFVMSQCPYGAKAMIAAKEFVDHFKKDVSLAVHFIGEQQGGQLRSMHGQGEVDEDVRERCAIQLYGKEHQFLSYLACRSRDYKNEEWKPCADEAGMDAAAIQKCFDGEGKGLLAESFALADSLGIASSPTFLVNNKRDFNAISASAIQREFCKDNPAVAACKEPIAEAPEAAAQGGQADQAAQCN